MRRWFQLEEIEAKELVSKLKGKRLVQTRAPSATQEWLIDRGGLSLTRTNTYIAHEMSCRYAYFER
jgi:hypothetical protein